MIRQISVLAFSLISLTVSAQEVMKIEKTDGTSVEYDIDNIKRFYFTEKSSNEYAKKLVRIDVTEVDGTYKDHDLWVLKYDNDGRIISYGVNDEITSLTYDQNVIRGRGGEVTTIIHYLLNNGSISNTSIEYDLGYWSDWTFLYNSYNKLERFISEGENNSDDYVNFTWSGNKLTEVSINSDMKRTFNYNGKSCNGFNPLIVMIGLADFSYGKFMPIISNPDLAGFKSNELPVSMSESEDNQEDVMNFTYEFYNDGYLKSCKGVWGGSDGGCYYEFFFTWE
jgi:hypothetical protein